MYDWSKYTIQNVVPVDMCAAIIMEHRAHTKPIKAIHLRPHEYQEFKTWLCRQLGRELNAGEKMQFDDVYIEQGDKHQVSRFLIEMWVDQKEFTRFMNENKKSNRHLKVA